MLYDLNSPNYKIVWSFVIIFMIIALWINLKGYKHNQIMFYLQTLSFLPYYLGGARFSTAQFLFNTKVSYFKFGTTPLYNVIPAAYFESS